MLIDGSDIRKVRQLSTSLKADKINVYIADAELSDLRPLLGERLYTDLLANPTHTGDNGNYPDLLNGSTYTYSTFSYSHPGIKVILANYAYARYRFFGSDVDTPFGVVQKQTQDGFVVSTARNREVYTALRKVALDQWDLTKAYLNRMAGDTNNKYEYWYFQRPPLDDDQRSIIINKITLS